MEKLVRKYYDIRNEKIDFTKLKAEVSRDYSRSVNKFVFDKYLRDEPEELVMTKDDLPEAWGRQREITEHGRLQLSRSEDSREIKQAMQAISLNGVINIKETITMLQEIHEECRLCLKLSLFDLTINKSVNLDEFRAKQDMVATRCMNYFKKNWVPKVARVIRETYADISEEFLSLEGPLKKTYEGSKLSKAIQVSRQIMQSTLLTLAKKNYQDFYQYLVRFIPQKVIINSPKEVHNHYNAEQMNKHQQQILNDEGFVLMPAMQSMPLFNLNIVVARSRTEFEYSNSPDTIKGSILDLFDRFLRDLGRIQGPEETIFADEKKGILYKPKRSLNLKVPKRMAPTNLPNTQSSDYKMVEDENYWVWTLYEKLEESLERALKPLRDYLRLF